VRGPVTQATFKHPQQPVLSACVLCVQIVCKETYAE
jgi:hypothetical protein